MLFSDPVSWIRSGLGSPIRLIGLICLQLTIGATFLFKIEKGAPYLVVVGSIIPCMFYYAAYRLLTSYDAKVGTSANWRKVPDWFVFLVYALSAILIYIEFN